MPEPLTGLHETGILAGVLPKFGAPHYGAELNRDVCGLTHDDNEAMETMGALWIFCFSGTTPR